MSYLTGIVNTSTTCSACLYSIDSSIQVGGVTFSLFRSASTWLLFPQTYSVTTMQGTNYNKSLDNCWCVKSYTHYHVAKSPAFDLQQYTSTEYSTWAESSWVLCKIDLFMPIYNFKYTCMGQFLRKWQQPFFSMVFSGNVQCPKWFVYNWKSGSVTKFIYPKVSMQGAYTCAYREVQAVSTTWQSSWLVLNITVQLRIIYLF